MKLARNTPAADRLDTTVGLEPGTGYENNYSSVEAELMREEWLRTYALIQELAKAKISGIVEITVRSHAGSVSLPIISSQRGMNLWLEMNEMLGDKMSSLEEGIVYYTKQAEKEEVGDTKGTSKRSQAFAFCLPMRPLSDAEFAAMPPEARRMYDEHRAESITATYQAKGEQVAQPEKENKAKGGRVPVAPAVMGEVAVPMNAAAVAPTANVGEGPHA